MNVMDKFLGIILIILIILATIGCKTTEQRQIEHYQNLKATEWELGL